MGEPQPFVEKVRRGPVTVAVVGLGYVGLPLAVGFARAGARVIGIDVNAERVASLNGGQSHIPDVPGTDVAAAVSEARFRATTDFAASAAADASVICVPTPFT